ncbi:uncharacterized protein cubi_03670 [Cryptosporidium ubiquitum]|uniref:Uncharacterized protein n=1 Tax=Cryptosporidium ubiquitum TaxID=857276 RepID=A0A1J4MEZ2_9CRYT|nr:uncharacterized protein cubi_03670 [Cryptosporidium ubiquitum]OII72800.1 hypothetical protein cubi_03670 [Cryptosporidium ubiquitum]
MVTNMASSSNYRLSSSLSPIRNKITDDFQECDPMIKSTNFQPIPKYNHNCFENSNTVNVSIQDEAQIIKIKSSEKHDFLIYDKNLFRFKVFVVILLYMSRSIIETRNIHRNLDDNSQKFLKSLYDIIFFACIFTFTYISGKSFTISILTLKKTKESKDSQDIFDKGFSRFINIFTHPSFLPIKIVVYKSITKYFLPGFVMLYFIQPFSYYISAVHPIWVERITLSPINFFLDSLDRVIYKTALDNVSKKISYFPQVLIYLSFIRIICFPITELTKYIIECSFGEIKNSTKQNDSGEHYSNINISSKTCRKYSSILDISNSYSIGKYQKYLNNPLITNKLRYQATEINDGKNQTKYYFYEREFSLISLIGKATISILVIIMLYYYNLREFSMLVFIPVALPIITFSLAGHLSSITKVKISLALTYILLLFLLIPLKDYSIIWKLCLIFLLGVTDVQLSFMRSQYNNYSGESKSTSISIIHPIFKHISLLVFSVTTIYLSFFISESKYFENLSLYLNSLKEVSLLFLIITITSHPLFRSELYVVDNSYGIKQIKSENQNLFVLIFVHSIVIRVVSFFFESKTNIKLPIYINILSITLISLFLTELLYYTILLFNHCCSYLKSYFISGSKVKDSNSYQLLV